MASKKIPLPRTLDLFAILNYLMIYFFSGCSTSEYFCHILSLVLRSMDKALTKAKELASVDSSEASEEEAKDENGNKKTKDEL